MKKKFAVPKAFVSGGEEVQFSNNIPHAGAPYSYCLEGTYCGEHWMLNLTHEGLKLLILEMLKAL